MTAKRPARNLAKTLRRLPRIVIERTELVTRTTRSGAGAEAQPVWTRVPRDTSLCRAIFHSPPIRRMSVS